MITGEHSRSSLPHALYRTESVRALDRYAIEQGGVPGFELMSRAGRRAFRHLMRRWPLARHLTVLCGAGNNGGDGYIMAGLAVAQGLSVHCVAVGDPARLQGDARSAWAQAQELGVQVQGIEASSWRECVDGADVIVDAMLGTGLSGEVRDPYRTVFDYVARSGKPVLAVDVPSGLCSDTGRVLGLAIRAELTVTFIGMKQGLLTAAAPDYVGELVFDDLGVGEMIEGVVSADATRCDWPSVASLLPERKAASHKGLFGRVLIVGGDCGMGGAAILAAEAAARTGAGLVYLATRPEHVTAALTRCPDIQVTGVEHGSQLDALLVGKDVVVVGPGLGQSAWGQQMLQRVMAWGGPCVADADALNLLSRPGKALQRENWILTPHPGEAARMLGISTAEIGADRFSAVCRLAQCWGGVAVLKGAGTLIASRDAPVQVATTGNPGMAKGGMGDVLSGILGSLLAQGLPAADVASLGVCLHGEAADRLVSSFGYRGLLPQDLIAEIPSVLARAEAIGVAGA
ncbi:NAD(P)H-hydrate dehydratase [Mangrovitalea sediminis]|uniref:NAD(P)H-hydrate dehydratase n=1 Tax=Mangrovitalea sediminis TaxID=1982043 RepID=UPI000BE5763D|nr:NAD(P)H-hydrate dehydratase [Mangrovitalea sediminis]